MDIKKACRTHKTGAQAPCKHLQPGTAGRASPPSAENATASIEFLQREIEALKDRLDKPAIKVSKVAEAYVPMQNRLSQTISQRQRRPTSKTGLSRLCFEDKLSNRAIRSYTFLGVKKKI